MTVESATYINTLDATYPAGTDPKSEGDDHIRQFKAAVKATFPNVAGAVTPTHTELNYVDGVTSAIQTQLDAITAGAARNLLDNGQMKTWQRATTGSVADNNYVAADRWKVIADSSQIEMSRDTGESGYAMKLRVTTANKKFAVLQVLENLDAARLQGKTVTLSARLKGSGSNIDDVRLAILAWTGTADTVTDPVNAWNASGTNPTWATSWTAENTPADLSVTTDWATYSVSGALDTSSITNVAVVIFSNSTTPTTSDYLYIDWVQLEVGAAATTCEDRPASVDLMRCQRFYQRWVGYTFYGYAGAPSEEIKTYVPLMPPMRAAPTITDSEGSHTNVAGTITTSSSSPTMALFSVSATAAGQVIAAESYVYLTADL